MDGVERRDSDSATVNGADVSRVRAAIELVRRRTIDQIASLERSLAGIVEAAELTSTDDEHDPEGATIAYERAHRPHASGR